MAARFGATIVPFGAIGEDDVAEVSMCFSSHQTSFFTLIFFTNVFTNTCLVWFMHPPKPGLAFIHIVDMLIKKLLENNLKCMNEKMISRTKERRCMQPCVETVLKMVGSR